MFFQPACKPGAPRTSRTVEALDQNVRRAQLVRACVLLDKRSIAASDRRLATRGRSPRQGRVSVSHRDVGGEEKQVGRPLGCVCIASELGAH